MPSATSWLGSHRRPGGTTPPERSCGGRRPVDQCAQRSHLVHDGEVADVQATGDQAARLATFGLAVGLAGTYTSTSLVTNSFWLASSFSANPKVLSRTSTLFGI